MQRSIEFPENESAGILFSAEQCYCLDESSVEWIGEAKGIVDLPEDTYVGIIFNSNLALRRHLLRELDLSCIQMLYFHNPFELFFDEFGEDLGILERVVLNVVPDDEDCALLSSLHGLRSVNLTQSNITDEGLKMLCELQSLESLVVSYTNISDAGMDNLERLIDLRELDLSLTMISDIGLKKLSSLKTLEELRLGTTTIGDDGIVHLLQLRKLRYLDLSETAVSEDGFIVLQAGLGSCQFSY